MSTVLRIALTYFQMLSLQRWLNLGGLLLIAVAALVTVFGETMSGAKGVFTLCTFAACLILIVPGFGGGIAMRMASRPSIAHLRPHGRVRLLLGATLAMTLLALVGTLPSIASHLYLALHDVTGRHRFPEPLNALTFFWSVAAVGWIMMFAASRTLMVVVVFPLLPLSAMKLPQLLRAYPVITPIHVLAVAAGAWILFALWYLRPGAIRQPPGQSMSNAVGSQSNPFAWLMIREEAQAGAPNPKLATSHYLLGCGSYRLFVATGLWTAAIFLLMGMVTPTGRPGQKSFLLLFMLPFLCINCAIQGYMTGRRARLLWLRNGASRHDLFSLSERLGLPAAMITWSIVAAAVLVFMLVTDRAALPMALLFTAAQALFAVCAFYVGVALVRNWGPTDVALCLTLLLLLIVQMVFAHPQGGIPLAQSLVTLISTAVVLLPLRWYAMHRWRAIDWRLIAPPKLDWRRT